MKHYTVCLKSARYLAEGIKSDDPRESLTDRQEQILGFSQRVMDSLSVLLIGAGGLGGEIAHGLVRKGVGTIKLFDGDAVSFSNLSRQHFFKEDLCRNKAVCLGKNLLRQCIKKTQILCYPVMLQDAIKEGIDVSCDLVICAPDNNEVRIFASKYFMNKTPVIFTGLDVLANSGYIFIQKPSQACFGCAFPDSVNKVRNPCPNTPAIIDTGKVIAGFVLRAADSVVMDRKISWNYRQIFLDGSIQEFIRTIELNKDCSLCSTTKRQSK
jgi:molybdopterin/thiamine biosynthesis adenylyltransferase